MAQFTEGEHVVVGKPWIRWVTMIAMLAWLAPATAVAQRAEEKSEEPEQETLAESLKRGKASINLRYRFEAVDQDDFNRDAFSSTLRTTLGYGSKPYKGFKFFVQAENVADIGLENKHNNLGAGDRRNDVTDRPVIVDPPGTEMLQGYAQYQSGASLVRAGRQEVILDDARFVGNVGWRQNHQSFRALVFNNQSVDNLSFTYGYVDRAYRITGATLDIDVNLINAQYNIAGVGSLTGYAYLLRFDSAGAAGLETDTVGAQFKGQQQLGAARFSYEAEFAHQTDAGDNPNTVSADYLHLMAGAEHRGVGFRVGLERLDGSAEDGQLQTVLATLHAFNGWADKFLSTPVTGLEDLYFRLDGPAGPLRWSVVYHDFGAATGDADYGTEIDFVVNYRTSWAQSFGVKGAFYDAEDFSVDTNKVWLFTGYAF